MPAAHPTRQPYVVAHQPDAVIAQAAPVQNTWYPILTTSLNVRILEMKIYVATTGEDLELRLTIDGNVLVGTIAAVAGTEYIGVLGGSGTDSLTITTTFYSLYKAFEVEGRSIKVEVRKTSANGAGVLNGKVKWAQW